MGPYQVDEPPLRASFSSTEISEAVPHQMGAYQVDEPSLGGSFLFTVPKSLRVYKQEASLS